MTSHSIILTHKDSLAKIVVLAVKEIQPSGCGTGSASDIGTEIVILVITVTVVAILVVSGTDIITTRDTGISKLTEAVYAANKTA